MQNYWISIELSEESVDRIQRVRSILTEVVPNIFDEERDPHISVLPGIAIPENNEPSLRETIHSTNIRFDSISITGLDLYPKTDPYVISLNVTTDLSHLREELLNEVQVIGGKVHYEPVDPHITLFKTGDDPSTGRLTNRRDRAIIDRRIQSLETDSSVVTHWQEKNYTLKMTSY